jgi:hypothetical protein
VAATRPGASGDLFAIGNIPRPAARRLQVLIRSIPLLLMLGLVAVVVWMTHIYKRLRLDEHERLRQAVTHATEEVPEEFTRDERLLAKQSSWWSASMTVGVIIGAGVLYQLGRMFWPGLPSWTFLLIAILLHAAAVLAHALVRRTLNPWDPIEPGSSGFDWDLRAVLCPPPSPFSC